MKRNRRVFGTVFARGRARGPRLLAVMAGAALGWMLATSPAFAVTLDGRVAAGEYAFVYAIDYEYGPDRVPVSGGVVAFTTDAAGDHYLYYQVPAAMVDNTWGCPVGTDTTCSQIGQYRFNDHTFRQLWRSDSFGVRGERMVLRGTQQGDIKFQVDVVTSTLAPMEARGSGAQMFFTGGLGDQWLGITLPNNNGFLEDPAVNAAFFLDVQTSTAWNIEHFGPGGTGAISQADLDDALNFRYLRRPGVFRDSPATDASYADPTTDDPIAPDALTLIDDSQFSGWNYVVAFELKLDGSLFASGVWMDPASHQLENCGDGRNCFAVLDLGGAHFSPNKLGGSTLLNPVAITPIMVPEPASSLLVLGLLAAVVRRRRGPGLDRTDHLD